jgi:gluconate 2-dehydrogenase gamma chain
MTDIPKEDQMITRRTVIASAAFIPVSALVLSAQPVASSFSPTQRQTLEAFTNRLVPRDQFGPGASECGVADYIDRALSDFLAPEKTLFLEGLSVVDGFAQRSHGAPLTQLPAEQQDAVLTALEANTVPGFKPDSRTYFNRVRQLTMEGMFGDPFYGGNKAFAGWDLIRYPGPRLAVSPEEQKIRVEIKPVRISGHGAEHGH